MIRVLAAPASMPVDGNPYIDLLYAEVKRQGICIDPFDRRALLRRYDIVHVHWPELLIRWRESVWVATLDCAKVLGGLLIHRLRGGKLIWTGHDLGPHDMPFPRLYSLYIFFFVRFVDLLISLSPSATDCLLTKYRGLRKTPVKVVAHGHYKSAYSPPPDRAAARKSLRLKQTSAPVFLLLGQIRRYKNVPTLIERFSKLGIDAQLVVAGQVRGDESLEAQIGAAASPAQERIELRLQRVDASDIPQWHAVADVVVLPYSTRTSLHSGAVILALSMNVPVVAPDSGPMRDLQKVVGSQWLALFAGGVDEALLTSVCLLGKPRSPTVDLSSMDWEPLGRATAEIFRSTLRNARD